MTDLTDVMRALDELGCATTGEIARHLGVPITRVDPKVRSLCRARMIVHLGDVVLEPCFTIARRWRLTA